MGDNREILEAIQQLNFDLKTSIDQLREDFKQTTANNEDKFTKHETLITTHQKKLAEHEKEYRQRNVIIYGLNETEKNRRELEELVIQFFNITLKCTVNINEVDYITRIGPKVVNKTRPIKVRFLAYRKTLDVFASRGNLKNSNIKLHEDLPKDIIEERKELIPIMRRYREQGCFAIIKYNKLYVNGREVNKEDSKDHSTDNKKRQLSEDGSSKTPDSIPKQPKERKTLSTRRNSLSKLDKSGNASESILQYLQKEKMSQGISNTSNISNKSNTSNADQGLQNTSSTSEKNTK